MFTFEKAEFRASLALEDCKRAADLLDKCEPNDESWRIYYVACVSLLRSVGHILIKVDALKSEHHKQLISNLWQNLKDDRGSNAIFWGFIEPERNNILKNYLFSTDGFEQDAIAYGPDLENDPSNYELYFVDTLLISHYADDQAEADEEIVPAYAGFDVRDLVRDGISFWDRKLTDLELALHRMKESA